ncbi:hypothetical protein OY671_004186 [Metschnikowia pulcherrima]|nr:hypothetical protein OY671_004186 [Metschnikowia pulcherrima]
MSGTQLHKVLTHPKGGNRLGASAAAWNKIKQAATDSRSKKDSSDQSKNGVHDGGASSKDFEPSNLVENGPNGEVCIWYEAQQIYEIWGWKSVSSYTVYRGDSGGQGLNFLEANISDSAPEGDTLVLLSRFPAPGRSVKAMTVMPTADGPVFVSMFTKEGETHIEARAGQNVKSMYLLEFWGNEVSMKASSQFLVVSSSTGLLYVLRYSPKDLLVDANCDGSLQTVHSHSTRALIEKHKLEGLTNKTILLQTGTFDNEAIYDVVGSWLVYCPKRAETEYFKNLMRSGDDTCTRGGNDSHVSGSKFYTSVKLPPNGPVLLRAASSLANSAIDKIFKLSQIGTKKMKNYWNPENSLFDRDVSLHTISTAITNALYSTASKIKKQADMIGENEVIKIIDLRNGQIMALFKPPGGVSHLSLSEYDLQLAQATYRGDNFYIWDLYKLPNEVSFVGKFFRGKTSAVIKQIFWFVNNKAYGESQATNSGFGCITKKTGSVHWFNINYLFCANENDNHPNTMDIMSSGISGKGQFVDSWILPSVNAIQLLKLPGYSNIPSDIGQDGRASNVSSSILDRCNQLAFVDSDFSLRLVSPLNGKHTFKYNLPERSSKDPQINSSSAYAKWRPLAESTVICPAQQSFDTPLSQTEIETCVPFSNITKDKLLSISSYNLDSEKGFWDYFATFGNLVPGVVHEFESSEEHNSTFSSTDDLVERFNEGLVISQEDSKEYLLE